MEFVNFQISAFIVLFFIGMVLGGFFDLYRVFRSQIKVNKTVDLIGDLFFWLLTSIIIIPLIFWGTWLELRLYVWLALMVGLIFYYSLFSHLAIVLFLKLWRAAGWLPRKLLNQIGLLWLFFRRVLRKRPRR